MSDFTDQLQQMGITPDQPQPAPSGRNWQADLDALGPAPSGGGGSSFLDQLNQLGIKPSRSQVL